MNTLEMYKRLSNEDKKNLTVYCIYDSIYSIAWNEDYILSKIEVERIKELSHKVYREDEYYNLSPAKISDFITECYIKHNIPLAKIEDADMGDILQAVDEQNYDFFIEREIER